MRQLKTMQSGREELKKGQKFWKRALSTFANAVCNLDRKGETVRGDVKAVELEPPLELEYPSPSKAHQFRN